MKCNECKHEIPSELRILAYRANGKPVYFKLCDECMKKKWMEYKGTLKDEHR